MTSDAQYICRISYCPRIATCATWLAEPRSGHVVYIYPERVGVFCTYYEQDEPPSWGVGRGGVDDE